MYTKKEGWKVTRFEKGLEIESFVWESEKEAREYANGMMSVYPNVVGLLYTVKPNLIPLKAMTVKKVKAHEHVIGEEWEREYVEGVELDFMEEINVSLVSPYDFSPVQHFEVGEHIMENGDFNYIVNIK